MEDSARQRGRHVCGEKTRNGKDTMKLVWVQGDNMEGGWCLQQKVGWDLECKPGMSDFSHRQGHWRLLSRTIIAAAFSNSLK